MPASLQSDSVEPSPCAATPARPAPSAGAVLALSAEPLDVARVYSQVYLLPPHQRSALIKGGVPADHVDALAERMSIPKELLINALRPSRATGKRWPRMNPSPCWAWNT